MVHFTTRNSLIKKSFRPLFAPCMEFVSKTRPSKQPPNHKDGFLRAQAKTLHDESKDKPDKETDTTAVEKSESQHTVVEKPVYVPSIAPAKFKDEEKQQDTDESQSVTLPPVKEEDEEGLSSIGEQSSSVETNRYNPIELNPEADREVNIDQLVGQSLEDLQPVSNQTATETDPVPVTPIDPQDASMRSGVRYDKELTAEQKTYFQWDLVIAEFRALPAHTPVSDYYLKQWARKQLNLGWSLGQPVPDLQTFRAVYGTPQIYQVTKKQVPTLYVYEYAGNKSAVRSELLYKQNYNGFWIYVDSITGRKSVLQQRDSFAKYYDTHPIGPADVQLVFQYLLLKGIQQPGNTKVITKESGTFRKAVEQAQDLLFKAPVNGYGLLTPVTLEAIKTALKKAQEEKEKLFAEKSGGLKFKDVNNITGLAKDPPGISSRSGEWQDGGVNLRKIPFTPEDPAAKNNPVFLSEVENSIIERLPFGTRMTILRETIKGTDEKDPGWYWVMTETGHEGYVAKHLVQTKLPAPDVRYHLVKEGETLLGIARKYYSPNSEDRVGIVESGGEFRNYVLELARYNEKWRGDEAGAVFERGFDPNDPQSWKHTIVRKGLRMWIPSSAEMYYLIHNRPESQKFDNTNWLEDGGQWIIDNSPVTIMINSYLEWWATIPQEQREKNVQHYYKQQLALYEKLQADWSWLDTYITPLVPLIPGAGAVVGITFIYDLYIAFNIGYFEFLSKSDPKLLVLNAERTLRNLTQLEHYKGLLFGFFEGLYDWGKDLVDTFVMIGEAIGTMVDVLTDPDTYAKIGQFAGDAFEYVVSNIDEIKKSLEDMSFMEVITGMISGMRTVITSKGKEMGQGAAKTLVKFAGGSPYEQGHSIGKIIGFITPEIVLAVATEGIWTAVKGALKGTQIVTKILKPLLKGLKVGLELLKKAASAAGDIIKVIKNFIQSILSKAKKGLSKFWEKLQELFEGFHKFLKNKYDDAFKSKKAGNIDVDDYADTHKSRMKQEFENDPDFKKNDPDYQESLSAAIKAKAIVELNDALDPSPPVAEVVGFLNATINLPGGKTFKFERNNLGADNFRIYFNPTIEPNYSQGIRKDLIGHDGYYTRKKIREMIYNSEPGEYGKHTRAKTLDQAKSMSLKEAQYLPGLEVTQIERKALDNGILVKFDEGKKQLWKIYRNETPVGFNQGVETNWLRVEISSGVFHGHPIKLDGPNGVIDLLKDSKSMFPEEIAGSIKTLLGTSSLDKTELKALEKFLE